MLFPSTVAVNWFHYRYMEIITVTNIDLLDKYADYLYNRSYLVPNSIYAYMGDARKYIDYLGDAPAVEATEETIVKLIQSMVSQGRSNSSIQRAVVGVRSFYKFLKIEGLIELNPVKDFTTAKVNELMAE